MRFHSRLALGLMTSCVVAGAAAASPALDDGGTATPEPASTDSQTTTQSTDAAVDPMLAATQEEEDPVEYGAAIRIRNVRVPKAILELFLERSSGGASSLGIGAEFIRRRGTVELQFGVEYEKLQVAEGVWIESGDDVGAGSEADYVLGADNNPDGESLSWITLEFTFINHAVINKNFAIRYGGGAGLGIFMGNLWKYDVAQCNGGATNGDPEPGCKPTAVSGGTATSFTGPNKYDLPPVFPVINGIIGVQITPIEKLKINVEGGIRTAPFFGTSIAYFF